MEKIKGLDWLRGIAVLVVLASHFNKCGFALLPINMQGTGKSGVWLFFVLSSFLLSYQILNAEIVDLKFWNRWFMRRFLRVIPLFVVATTAYVLLISLSEKILVANYSSGLLPTKLAVPDVLFDHLILMECLGVFWTIAVEFKFYFILPAICLAIRTFDCDRFVCSLLIFLGCTAALLPMPSSGSNPVPFLPIFLLGTVLASSDNLREQIASSRHLLIISIMVVSMIPSVLTAIQTGDDSALSVDGRYPSMQISNTLQIVTATAWAVILANASYSQRSFRLLSFFGKYSYGMYLLHPIAIEITLRLFEGSTRHSARYQAAYVALVLTTAFAFASFHLFEKHLLNWKPGKREVTSR